MAVDVSELYDGVFPRLESIYAVVEQKLMFLLVFVSYIASRWA